MKEHKTKEQIIKLVADTADFTDPKIIGRPNVK
ncbi:hypothetical protein BDW_04905 [Bdellovibrio bacteriovorus W]|nr:hypothetical protein BDW_04905 [Bdellovibrio bacteriovorus W]